MKKKHYNSILKYANNAEEVLNSILLGPVKIYPWTWINTDSECRISIDDKKISIINRTEPYTKNQKTKTLILHYNSKDEIVNDFNKLSNFSKKAYSVSNNISLSASKSELIIADACAKVNLENISIDFTDDDFGKDFFWMILKAEDNLGKKFEEFIAIPAEFI